MSTRIIIGDALAELAKLPAESVHCCVTSPPYFGLRDYQTASWEGGDPACDHRKGDLVSSKSGLRNDGREHIGPYAGEKAVSAGMPYAMLCGKCGARRIDRQLGLEATPDEYVAAMVGVFREVRRVLRSDGTLWLNIGDSYAGGGHGGGGAFESERNWRRGNPEKNQGNSNRDGLGRVTGAKPKDLIGIPWLLAFALRADGWWLRQDIIWSKPNPMPESVTDRCTKAHEYIFLLSKSERYYYDAEAIKEPNSNPLLSDCQVDWHDRPRNGEWPSGSGGRMGSVQNGRNKRSVWTIATAPYAEAHFATFPPALVEPCILAGCPAGGTALDPFLGAGTTALVADRLGRNAIGIELNPTYSAMARRRIADDAGLFFEAAE